MLRRVGRTKPPAVSPLRVEQLEERLLLSSSGPQNSYSPVSAPATQPAMQAHQAGPADLAGSPAAVTPTAVNSTQAPGSTSEYANGIDTDSQTSAPAAQTGQAAYRDNGSSTANSKTAYDAYENSTTSGSHAYADVAKPQPAPTVDVSLVVAAGRAATANAPRAEPSNPMPPPNGQTSPAGADAQARAIAVQALVGLIHGETSAASPEAHTQPPVDQEFLAEGTERTDLEDTLTAESVARHENQVFLPQGVDVLAGMAPLDLRPVEQGARDFLGGIDAMSRESLSLFFGRGVAPWLAAGLVAAAAFELALWRLSGRRRRGLFAAGPGKASTWTWLPGGGETPWLENQ